MSTPDTQGIGPSTAKPRYFRMDDGNLDEGVNRVPQCSCNLGDWFSSEW